MTAMNVHWRKSTNESEKSRHRNLTRLSEKSSELVCVIKEAIKTLVLFFSLTRQAKDLKIIS
jgi:hypothetical protein